MGQFTIGNDIPRNDQEKAFNELHKAMDLRDEQLRVKDRKIEILEKKNERVLVYHELLLKVLLDTDFNYPITEKLREEIKYEMEKEDDTGPDTTTS